MSRGRSAAAPGPARLLSPWRAARDRSEVVLGPLLPALLLLLRRRRALVVRLLRQVPADGVAAARRAAHPEGEGRLLIGERKQAALFANGAGGKLHHVLQERQLLVLAPQPPEQPMLHVHDRLLVPRQQGSKGRTTQLSSRLTRGGTRGSNPGPSPGPRRSGAAGGPAPQRAGPTSWTSWSTPGGMHTTSTRSCPHARRLTPRGA